MSVTRFIHRNGQGAPTAGDLEVAEVAIDTLTGDVYTKDENGNVVPVGTDYDDTQIIADLAFEVDERKAADTRIEGDLQALDVSLNAGLTAEMTARMNADSGLSDRIDDLEGAPSAPGMVISDMEPAEADRVTGMQWLDVSGDDAQVWIWDEDKWVEFPSAAVDIELPEVLTEVCEGLTIGGGSAVFDLEKANNFTLTHSGNFTASFTNPPAGPGAVGFTLQLAQPSPAAGNTITWPASVAWSSGDAPTLSAGDGDVDVFTFFTTDGGVTYYGFTAGQGMA